MIITSQQFNEAYNKLPYTIREFLAGEELGIVAEEIGKKHGLHVDMIGVLEREASNMLLGLTNPTQFVAELKSAGIPADMITPIAQELNERVFVPLHERMRRATEEEKSEGEPEQASAPAEPAIPPAPPVAAPVPPPIPVSVPLPQPIAPIQQPVVTAPVPPPAPAPIHLPVPESRPIVPPAAVMPAIAPEAEVRTMATDMAMVKAGVIHPHAVHQAVPNAPVEPVYAPPQPLAPIAVPVPPVAPMPSAPTFVVPPATPQPRPLPTPPSSAPAAPRTAPANTPSDNRQALHEVLKSYGVDPYREPVDD